MKESQGKKKSKTTKFQATFEGNAKTDAKTDANVKKSPDTASRSDTHNIS